MGEGERSLKKFPSGKCLGTSERVKFNMDQSNNCKNQKPSDVFNIMYHKSQADCYLPSKRSLSG